MAVKERAALRPNHALEEKLQEEERLRQLREFKANPINYHPELHQVRILYPQIWFLCSIDVTASHTYRASAVDHTRVALLGDKGESRPSPSSTKRSSTSTSIRSSTDANLWSPSYQFKAFIRYGLTF